MADRTQVERDRTIASAAWRWAMGIRGVSAELLAYLDREHPWPTEMRPRVVPDPGPGGLGEYCFRPGSHYIEHRYRQDDDWRPLVGIERHAATVERVKVWADLLARPTEEVHG